MWTLPAALLLAGSYTAAKLSLTDTIKAVKESICKAGDGNELCINPEGPLNLLRAHALVGNSIVAKKRLFAAPGAIAYRLVYDEKKTLFEYKKRPEDGPIREFPSADPDAMAYLRAYYGVLRIMFRAVDMKVGPGAIKAAVYREDASSDADHERPPCIEFTCQKNGRALLNLPLEAPGRNWEPSYADNALAVVDFFAKYGGIDVQKKYGLGHYSDSPSSLILTYIYEFAGDREFIGEVFGHVDAILRKAFTGDELAAVHARFFASSSAAGPEYVKAYSALEKIGEIDSRCVFPFNRTSPPLDNQVVCPYDEKNHAVVPEPSYSDCTEIALYNLFCCMLLDPKTREYSTAHLEHRGCNPTKQLLDFFADGSAESDGSPALGTHQEWARVAQGLTLVLGDGSSTGADAEESNLIAYKKGVPGSTQVELKGNLGNFLMALAKIAGLPDEVTRELHGLLPGSAAEGQNGQVDFGKAGVSISKALNCISLMRVDVELSELHVEEEKLYGTLLLSFLPRDSCAGALPQTVELKFIPGHALFAHKLDAIVLSAAERECLEAYIEASSGCSELFLSLASESVGRFLSATDGTSLPNAHAGRLGVAGGPVEMYDRLVRWMACTDMHSQSGLVVANDQLIPAFMKHNEANFGRIQALEERLADPTTDSKSKARFNSLLKETKNKVAGSPLTILVSNILGRLPLTDKHTRDLFFQIMRFCVDERKYVFPQVVMPKKIYPEVGNSSLCRSFHPIWKLSEYEAPNMLAVYLNLSTLAGHAPINPSHCYSETEYYFEAVLSDRNRRRVLETLFKHCDKNTLRILRDNYLVRPCEAGTTRYYLLAAFWACLSASAERYEEIYQICDKWENALCPLMGHLEQKILRSRYKLSPLSSSTLAKVFPRGPTPKQLKALLRIYGLFANTEAAYDGIYEVFVARQDMLDLPFAVGYCLVLVDSYKKIYLRMSCDDHSPGDYDAIPVDLLGSFIDKLKGLYLRGADSEPEHENAFSAVDAQLKDLDECLQKIVGEILREAAKAAQRANATTTA